MVTVKNGTISQGIVYQYSAKFKVLRNLVLVRPTEDVGRWSTFSTGTEPTRDLELPLDLPVK